MVRGYDYDCNAGTVACMTRRRSRTLRFICRFPGGTLSLVPTLYMEAFATLDSCCPTSSLRYKESVCALHLCKVLHAWNVFALRKPPSSWTYLQVHCHYGTRRTSYIVRSADGYPRNDGPLESIRRSFWVGVMLSVRCWLLTWFSTFSETWLASAPEATAGGIC